MPLKESMKQDYLNKVFKANFSGEQQSALLHLYDIGFEDYRKNEYCMNIAEWKKEDAIDMLLDPKYTDQGMQEDFFADK